MQQAHLNGHIPFLSSSYIMFAGFSGRDIDVHWIRALVGPKASLDAVERREKNLLPLLEIEL